jgi:ubiquinone/menaquinone biosynthesis C-methylase UbiE
MSANPWNERAQAYRDSAPHAAGPDLDLIDVWAGAGDGLTALDVGTGGGHLARRLEELGFAVTTVDPSPGMRPDIICQAEELPFATGSFDLVASRLAAHHYANIAAALGEMARVTRSLVILEDLLFVGERVEDAETLRDPSHVRAYSLEELKALFGAVGLSVTEAVVMDRAISFASWLERCGCAGANAERARELVSHRLNGNSYTSTVFLMMGLKGN